MPEPRYTPVTLDVLGSWNPDVGIESMPQDQFSEVRNLRQVYQGTYILRGTPQDKTDFNVGSVSDEASILCRVNYIFIGDDTKQTLFEVVAIAEPTAIKFYALNRSPIAGSTVWSTQFRRAILQDSFATDIDIPYSGIPTPVRAFMTQYGSYIIITIYGLGTWQIYPDNNNPDQWVIRKLGKDRASAPSDVPQFADTFNGDLFVILYDDTIGTVGRGVQHHMHPKLLLAGQERTSIFPPVQYQQVPINAKYYNSKQTVAFDIGVLPSTTTGLRFWQYSEHDPSIANQDSRSSTHLQQAAWGYKTVFVHKFKDGRGNTITYRSIPSVDFWVPNMIYCPPQIYAKFTADANTAGDRMQQYKSGPWTNPGYDGPPVSSELEAFTFSNLYDTQGLASQCVQPYPSAQALQELGQSIIAYNSQSFKYNPASPNWHQHGTGMDENLFLASMYWTGFWRVWFREFDGGVFLALSEEFNFDGDVKTPYFCEVPADQLAQAPLTKFSWSDFTDVPTDVVEIEFYRTAYSGSNLNITKDGLTQPLYQPHQYGYAGSLTRPPGGGDTSFTDQVKDSELDFGRSPDKYEGLASDSFSGSVITEYNRHLVIGDIYDLYNVRNPWDQYQCYIWGTGGDPGNRNVFIPWGGVNYFGVQYVDANGETSAIIPLVHLEYTSSEIGDTTWGHAAFVLPRGYQPYITTIRLIYWDGTNFRLVTTTKPEDAFAVVTYDQVVNGTIQTDTGSGDIVSKDAGAIIWSDQDDIYAFSSGNYLNAHPSDTVTALHSVIGRLFVFANAGISLTDLAGHFEEMSKDIGVIGRFGSVKLDSIIAFMSSSGLYFANSTGIVHFPGFIDQLIRGYLNEAISGVPMLENGHRIALDYFRKFQELWIYLPGSNDIGGVLPARLVIYKFFGDLYNEGLAAIAKGFLNYEFELLPTGNPAYPLGEYNGSQSRVLPLIFSSIKDGSLYAEFKDETTKLIHTVNVDTDGIWQGGSLLEKPVPLGASMTMKLLRSVRHTGNALGKLFISTGMPNASGTPGYLTGNVWQPNTEWQYFNQLDGINEIYNHRVPWEKNVVSHAGTPLVLWRSEANEGQHNIEFSGIQIFLQALHQHPE